MILSSGSAGEYREVTEFRKCVHVGGLPYGVRSQRASTCIADMIKRSCPSYPNTGNQNIPSTNYGKHNCGFLSTLLYD